MDSLLSASNTPNIVLNCVRRNIDDLQYKVEQSCQVGLKSFNILKRFKRLLLRQSKILSIMNFHL